MSKRPRLPNPFPGLRPFRSDEDYLFFGRDEQTMELMERLQNNRFVAVVGTSGGGKSSLVRCGLLSRLQGGGMVKAGAHWEIAVMHPGGNPLAQLADALIEADLYDSEEEDVRPNLAATLGRSQFGLIEAVRQARLADGVNFLLVVDQFEEIFRFEEAGAAESEIANDFIGMLLEATVQADLPIYVVTTMRSDFIGDCSRFEGLAEAVNRGEYLIPRLSREQFKAVIEGPIRVAGGQIAPRLLQRLLNDLGEEQDQLPCLQHALMRTWQVWSEREDAHAIDLEDYQRVGKMSQALSLHADEIYESLASDEQRQLCAAAFKALTVLGSEKRGIRRPRRLDTLCQILEVEQEELLPILDAFRRAEVTFLQPPEGVELQDSTVIDLSHESLMRVWKRLRDWVDEEVNSVGIFRRLSESTALYAQRKAGLYRDPELSVARNWLEQSHPNATWAAQYEGNFDEVMAYLDLSREAAEEEQRAKEAALQHELEQAKALAEAQRHRAEEQARFSARLKWLVRGMSLVAAVAVVAMVIAIIARQEAQQNEARATENELLALAEKERADSQAENFRQQVYKVQLLRANSALQQKNGGQAFAFLQECEEALREWEWRYMAHQANQSVDSFQAFEGGSASQIRFSPDGKQLLATSSQLLGFKVWDVASRELVWDTTRPFTGRGAYIVPASYSADGKLLAVRVEDSLEIWNVASRQKIQEIDNGTAIHRLAFDPDGETIWATRFGRFRGILLGDSARPQQWEIATGQRLIALELDQDRIHPPLLSPDGRAMVAINYFGGIQIWDTDKTRPARLIEDLGIANDQMAFSPDGKRLVVGTEEGALRVYDTSDWTKIETIEGRYSGSLIAMSFSPDGQLLAGAVNSTVMIWDGETFEELAALLGQSSELRDLAFAPDGSTLASSDVQGNINFWSSDQSGADHSLVGHTGTLREIAYSPDGKRLVSTNFDGTLRVWEVATGKEIMTLKGHGYWTDAVDYSPDGRQILSGAAHPDSTVRIWDAQTGALIRVLRGHTDGVFWVDYSPDGKTALSGDNGGVVKLWNTQSGKELYSMTLSDSAIEGAKFSPDGTMFAILPRLGRELTLWDTATGKLVKSLDRPDGDFRCVVFSPDGNSVVFGAAEPTVVVCDIETGESRTFFGTGGRVRTVAYSPDGKRLFAGGDRGVVVMWDVATGEQMLTMEGDPATIWSVKASPDGSTVASTGGDGVIRIWETERISGELNLKRRLVKDARALVEEQAKIHPFSADVIASLRTDATLDPAIKDAAVELAATRGDLPLPLLLAGQRTLKNRESDADALALALRQIETAVAQLPDSPEAYYTLGMGQFLMGKYAEALETAERSNEIAQKFYGLDCSFALMVQAMAYFRLGEAEKAKAFFARSQAVPESHLDPRGGHIPFVQMAEELMQ